MADLKELRHSSAMRTWGNLVAAATMVVAAVCTLSAPAALAASCPGPEVTYQKSAHVFTGSIADAEDGRVLLRVHQVWSGPRVPERVWVSYEKQLTGWYPWANSDGKVPDGYSSDQDWVVGTDAQMATSICRVAAADDSQVVAQVRPDTVRKPLPLPAGTDEPDGAPTNWPAFLGGGALAVAVAAGSLLLWRRRSHPRPAAV